MRRWVGLGPCLILCLLGLRSPSLAGAEETVPGERLDPATYGPSVVESMATVLARDQYLPRPYPKGLRVEHGEWVVPSRRATSFPHSPPHNVINKWGDTRMGIGFSKPVDVEGAWFAGQAAEGAWTTGVRAIGYRAGQQVQTTDWFEQIDDQPRWFAMKLRDVDRIEIEARPVLRGGGWYGMDDLTYTVVDPDTGQLRTVVITFDDLEYGTTLTGTTYAGLVWERGSGEIMESEGVPAPQVPPGLKQDEEVITDEPPPTLLDTRAVLPALYRTFQGVIRGDAGQYSYPPDTCGAVGPNHYVEVVNTNFSVYTRTGTRLINVSLGSFLPGSRGDPRVLFDHHSGRWVVMNTDFDTSATIYLAVSLTNDPTGSWFKTSFVSAQGGDAGRWPDYPTLGVDANGLYITAYMVGGPGHTIFAIDKAPLIAPSPSLGTITAWRNLAWAYAIQPCHTYGTPAGEYFVSVESSNQLRLRRVNPPLTAPTLTNVGTITVPSFSAPPTAPALGSSTDLDTVDQRLMMAVYRNGSIWTAHTIGYQGRAACRWYEIQASPRQLLQSGMVASETLYFFFPSIMVNQYGHVAMAFSGSNASQYVGCYYTGRAVTDPPGAMATPVLYKAGTAPQNNIDGYGRNRWGDYSYTTLDPTDQTMFWTVQEYGHANNIWGTYVAALTLGGDCNGNGVPDYQDIASGTSADCNANGVPDECDIAAGTSTDCNGNGVPDTCDLAAGTSADCNANSVPDECDIAGGGSQDCNANGRPDECDIASGVSADCNGNGVPDECDRALCGGQPWCSDCNGNGVMDVCDIGSGVSPDCNGNEVPDECDLANCDGSAWCQDCNGNSVPDTCDILYGTSRDCGLNGIPDECDIATCDGSLWCRDCNNNGVPDECDFVGSFTLASPVYSPFGYPSEYLLTLWNAPAAMSDVTLSFTALGDINAADEYISVDLNGTPVGTVYQTGGIWYQCVPNQSATLNVLAVVFNTARVTGGGNVIIRMVPSPSVSPVQCTETRFEVVVSYQMASASADSNGNGIPDECEGNCPGDMNCDGSVTFADIELFVEALSGQAAWGYECPWLNADCNADGDVTYADIDPFVMRLGSTCP
jgi:hypothetical protein